MVGCDDHLAFVILEAVDLVKEGETVVESDGKGFFATEDEWLEASCTEFDNLGIIETKLGFLRQAKSDLEVVQGRSVVRDGADVAIACTELILFCDAHGFRSLAILACVEVFDVFFTRKIVVIFVKDDVFVAKEIEVFVNDVYREGVLEVGVITDGVYDVAVSLGEVLYGDLIASSSQERLGDIGTDQ